MTDALWIECHACSEVFKAGRRPLGSRVPCPECGAEARVEHSQLRQPPPQIIGASRPRQSQHVANPNPQAFFAFVMGLGVFMAVIFYAIVSHRSAESIAVRSRMSEPRIPIRFQDYDALHNGMTLNEANKVLRSDGIEQSRAGLFITYLWSNNDGTGVSATFDDGRLRSKAQFGLK